VGQPVRRYNPPHRFESAGLTLPHRCTGIWTSCCREELASRLAAFEVSIKGRFQVSTGALGANAAVQL
jgi:hypothetical protein